MGEENYLKWLSGKTETAWWHDSGDPKELEAAIANGAVGVTTNPILCAQALKKNAGLWGDDIRRALETEKTPASRAEALMKIVVMNAVRMMEPAYRASQGKQGYVCAQVDPSLAGNRDAMYTMGKRFSSWAPNIAVKLPATSAGLDVMEKLCSEGAACTITVSFTVPQVYTTGKRYQEVVRAKKGKAGRCFAVIMIGRLDDYLREVIADNGDPVSEQELQMAGLSVTKHAYELYRKNGFDATLLVAALRGNYHMIGLAGGELIMSIHPAYQKSLLEGPVVYEKRIGEPVPPAVQKKLDRVPEFAKAYKAQGIPAKEMVSFGLTQRTLSSFIESGWKLLEQFQL